MIIQGLDVRKTGCVPETGNVSISILVGLLRFLEKSRRADSYLSLQIPQRFETSYVTAIISNRKLCRLFTQQIVWEGGGGFIFKQSVNLSTAFLLAYV